MFSAKLFSALDKKVVGFLKLTDCLLILTCENKGYISFIKPEYFLGPLYLICLSRV